MMCKYFIPAAMSIELPVLFLEFAFLYWAIYQYSFEKVTQFKNKTIRGAETAEQAFFTPTHITDASLLKL